MPLLLLLIHLETEAIEEGMEKEAKQERESQFWGKPKYNYEVHLREGGICIR